MRVDKQRQNLIEAMRWLSEAQAALEDDDVGRLYSATRKAISLTARTKAAALHELHKVARAENSEANEGKS